MVDVFIGSGKLSQTQVQEQLLGRKGQQTLETCWSTEGELLCGGAVVRCLSPPQPAGRSCQCIMSVCSHEVGAVYVKFLRFRVRSREESV